MATKENTSTSTITGDARQQLREIADQLEVFSDVLASAIGAVSDGASGEERTVAYFAINQISPELAGFGQNIYELTKEGGEPCQA
jgi:hypothetical protein